MCASDHPRAARAAVCLSAAPLAPLALLAAVLAWAPLTGHAADREQEQIHRLRLQMRSLQQERDTAQGALQDAQAEAKRQQAEVSKAEAAGKAREGAVSRRLKGVQAELATAQADKAQLQADLEALRAQLAQAQAADQAARAQAADAARQADATQVRLHGQLDTCRTHNGELVQLGEGLLDRYTHKGIAEVLGAEEPFLQLGRVKLENLHTQYQDKIKAAKDVTDVKDPTQVGLSSP